MKNMFENKKWYRLLPPETEERGEKMPYVKWDKTDKSYKVVNYNNITLHQIEMWLCEFQKYWKMIIGEGKQRGKYMPK